MKESIEDRRKISNKTRKMKEKKKRGGPEERTN